MRQPAGLRQTLGQKVAESVRADILAGRHAPAARLSPRAVAASAGVSLSVAREGLTRLVAEGLVVASPNVGFSVVPLDLDDVRDTAALRVSLEGAALRDSIANADVEYETRVLASHYRLTRAPRYSDAAGRVMTEEWAAAHATFHAELISNCPNRRARRLVADLRGTAEVYRRWSETLGAGAPSRDVEDEHRALMQAALDRDADRAVVLITDHIAVTARLLEDYLRSLDGVSTERRRA